MREVDIWYNEIRHTIGSGWIVLFRGKSLLSKTIQFFDKAYFNHAGVVVKYGDRLFIIDSNARGVHPEFLSHRISQYEDVCFLQPLYSKEILDSAVEKVLSKAEEGIKYDFLLLPQIAIKRYFGIKIKMNDNKRRDICSEFVRRYTLEIGSNTYSQESLGSVEISPQDFVRNIDLEYVIHRN